MRADREEEEEEGGAKNSTCLHDLEGVTAAVGLKRKKEESE